MHTQEHTAFPMMDKVVTIERHIIEQQRTYPSATGEFSGLLTDISLAAKIVTRDVRKAGLVDILGLAGGTNATGDDQKKLDIFANDVFINALNHKGRVCVMASEEHDEVIPIPKGYPCGKYVVVFDPLDGSGNIDANVSIGTIFSILRRKTPPIKPGTLEDVLQPGTEQVAAGYILYGSSTMMVYTTGHGVHGFTLDPTIGEFLLSHENIRTPPRGKILSINEGNYRYFEPGVKQYIKYLQQEDKLTGRPYTSRYIGSFVADFHRNLLYGGIYLYPGSSKAPAGKLRLIYEVNPMAFIVEQAGGRCSDGHRRVLDIQPTELHQRVPTFIGSEEDVRIAEEFVQGKRTVDAKSVMADMESHLTTA